MTIIQNCNSNNYYCTVTTLTYDFNLCQAIFFYGTKANGLINIMHSGYVSMWFLGNPRKCQTVSPRGKPSITTSIDQGIHP